MGIKEDLDKLHSVTDGDIDQIIFDQRIEDEEKKLEILKEMRKFKSFEDYVNGHEKDFDMVDITDDFKQIFISGKVYQNMHLDMVKKMGTVADHYDIFIRIEQSADNKITRRDFRVERKYV